MKTILKKCIKCNNYTLKLKCVNCGEETISPIPPRYSIEDRYGKYRRKLILQTEECE